MDYNAYRELENFIDAYLNTGNREILATIQKYIETKEGCRESLMEDLIEHSQFEYIKVFSTDDQVKIISDFAAQILQRKYLAWKVSWMLFYVSDKVLEQILSTADYVVLVRIMSETKEHIRVIGKRLCDSSAFWTDTTNIFSRMGERMAWYRIYRKCRRNLKK